MRRKGFVIFSSLVLLFIIPVLLLFLVGILNKKVKSMVYQRKKYKLLYLAEAGIEKKIAEILINPYNLSGIPEEFLGDGSFEVETEKKGNILEIISTSFWPSKKDCKLKKRIVAEIKRKGVVPEEVVRSKGNVYIDGDVTCKGVIRSDGKVFVNGSLVLDNPENRKAGIISSYQDDGAILIKGKIVPITGGVFLKSGGKRGDFDVHMPREWDGSYEIYNEKNIENKANVLVYENDRNVKRMVLPSINLMELLENLILRKRKRIRYTDVNPLVLDGGIYIFENGVSFIGSNSIVINENSVILVTGGRGIDAVYFKGEFGSNLLPLPLNIIVVGGDWKNALSCDGKIFIEGVIVSKGNISITENI
ncbi:MAG: hypothetical protein DRI36_02585, partial [Caldiserica bacterium]